MRRVATVAALVGLLGSGAAVGAAELLPRAAAATCTVMTISATPRSLIGLTLSSVSVERGGCVEFSNTTSASVRVTVVGTSYAQTVPAKGSTSGSSNYLVTKAVTVRATSGLRSGSGSITLRSASPTPTRTTPTPSHSASPRPSATSTPKPTESRHQHQHHKRGSGHRVKVSLPPLPPLPTDGITTQPRGTSPVVAPGLTTASAAPSQPTAGSRTTGVATVVEPVTGNRKGLPVLIAAVVLAGLVAAYGRALLGYNSAVDNRPSRPHRA